MGIIIKVRPGALNEKLLEKIRKFIFEDKSNIDITISLKKHDINYFHIRKLY